MFKYFINIKNGSKNKGNSSFQKYLYLTNKNVKNREICFYKSDNLPIWSNGDAVYFWKSVDKYERSNARLYKEIKFNLPIDISITDRKKIVSTFCEKILSDKFTYSYSIYENYDDFNNLKNSFVNIIFNQRVNDNLYRNEKKYFSRFNSKNNVIGGTKKDNYTNSKKWLIDVRKQIHDSIEYYLNKSNNNNSIDESHDIQLIPQCHVSKKSYFDYKDHQIINHEIEMFLKIENQNNNIYNLLRKKKNIEKKIYRLESKLNQINILENLLEKGLFDFDIINNMELKINGDGKLVFKLSLYNSDIQKNSRVIYYTVDNDKIIPEFNIEHLRNESILGIYVVEHNALGIGPEKIKITLTSTPIDVFYLACIDRLQNKDFFETKNIYISTFDNINNIEEIIPFLSKTNNLNFSEQIYLAFDKKRSSVFLEKLKLNDKINDFFWFESRFNRINNLRDELIFELDKINRVYSINDLRVLDSINKNILFNKLYPQVKKIDDFTYQNVDEEIIYLDPKENSCFFEKSKLKLTGSINLSMKLGSHSYITACSELSKLLNDDDAVI